MDGLIILDKPVGLTSAKALYRVRKITGERKSGHAGSLDPMASGVLLLCMGKATKLVEAIMEQPKVYRATARLDLTSPGFDAEGEATSVEVPDAPDGDAVARVLAGFEGVTAQVPPDRSAVKVRGVPAYRRARREQPLDLKPRPVRIDWIHVHRYDWPELDFEMCCGRGTYVRALIRDVGSALRCGGMLTSLRRLRVGPFTIEEAMTLDGIAASPNPAECLVPLGPAGDLLNDRCQDIPPPPEADGSE
jgi:tRNA pseudouridine55 synthase